MTYIPAATHRCRHGHLVNECPHAATVCNYSREYITSLAVPPPFPAHLTPKQIQWEAHTDG